MVSLVRGHGASHLTFGGEGRTSDCTLFNVGGKSGRSEVQERCIFGVEKYI
jgi:hypothetical protein